MNQINQINQADVLKIAKGAGIAGFGDVVMRFLTFATVVMITQAVGAELYGIFLLAFTVISIAGILCKAGLDNGVLRFVSMYKGQNDNAHIKGTILFSLKATLVLSLGVGLLLFLFSGTIADKIFYKPELENIIKALIIVLPPVSLTTVFLSSIHGFQLIKYKVYVERFIQPISMLVLLVILFSIGYKLFGIILATIISSIIACFSAFYFLIKIFPFYKREIVPVFENGKLIGFSVPLLFQNFLALLMQRIDLLMIGYFLASSDVGIYGAAAKVAITGILVFASFEATFAPVVSEFYGRKEIKRMENLFKIVVKQTFTVSFPIFLLMIIFAKPIMEIFGPSFISGAPCLIILSIGYLITSLTCGSGYILIMIGKPQIELLNSCILCIGNIVLNYILIPRYGILGAAMATGTSIAVINLLKLGEVYYFLKVYPYESSFLKPLTAGMVSAGVIFLLKNFIFHTSPWMLFFLAIIFGLIYISLLRLFGFEKEDKLVLDIVRKKWNIKYNSVKKHY